ncbi:peroxisome assembly protein 26 isoform X2 [Rhineura floridana]|uniref:peroxisome assembly protein 26 isoform X2 n=1 Tax=Rhineura floridana TaxID=261503 RepID=UPI002AC84A50|nr:peroxisome assembly protein 26 isoform X2 [Rhineura floridana]
MMRNDLSVAFAGIGEAGSLLRSSEPPSVSPVASQAAVFVEEATDLLVMHRDFAAALDRCERGCQSLTGEPESEDTDNILLHGKVEEPRVMLEVSRDWLCCSANQHLPSYGLLVQLHLLHVLLPLGHFAEAEELIRGCKALSKEQQVEAHESIKEKKLQWLQNEEEEEGRIPEEHSEMGWKQQLDSVSQKVLTILTQLGRVLGTLAGIPCSIPYKKVLLAAFMLCLIVVRLDPASPASLPFLNRLIRLFHQAQLAAFSPHYRPPIQD